jgi:AraC-like DNA-binding protein/ligand-binding sensor protein
MAGLAPVPVLPSHYRRSFIEQFNKDLKFFQLVFLLINKSCPIKKIDLVWAEDGPANRVGLRRLMGTADALTSSSSRLLAMSDQGPDPRYCSLIHDHGRREAESCGISDKAAEKRVRRTGKPQVYRCHAGLVDIGVPVFSEGQHIATLLTGQVLNRPPTTEGFVQIRKDVAHLEYVDLEELEKAYWEVPVVTDTEIQNAIEVLQVLAEYLGNAWQRLSKLVRDQQRQTRELQLSRKEFGHLLLDGGWEDRGGLGELMKRIGLTRLPNRVLVVKLESENEYPAPQSSFDLAFATAIQAVEETCEAAENSVAVYLRQRGVCVFVSDKGAPTDARSQWRARSLAHKILNAVAGRSDIRASIGIGGPRRDWKRVVESYHEACMALAGGDAPIAVYQRPRSTSQELCAALEDACRAFSERRTSEATLKLNALPLLANRYFGDSETQLGGQRQFFASALEAICFALHNLGCHAARATELRSQASAVLERASKVFELQEAFRQSVDEVLDEVRRLFLGRRDKLIERVCRTIDRQLAAPCLAHRIGLEPIAASLGISAGHLSRTFRKSKGISFERYVMVRRVERAKRLLLEPTSTVALVAEQCGFSDAAYLSRVFRLIAGCSPSQYVKSPAQFESENNSR